MHTATYYIDLLLSGITVGSLYALIAIGYTMVYGILRLINFAHGDIFMMAGFFMVYISASMPMAVAIPVVLIMTVALGLLIERAAYKPLRSAPRMSVMISAIGVSYLLQNLATYITGGLARPYPEIPFLKGTFMLGALKIKIITVVTPLLTILLVIALVLFINHTKTGMAMRAVSRDFDGHQGQQYYFRDLHHRLFPCRCRLNSLLQQLRSGQPDHRRHARTQGLCCRGLRRHRLDPRGCPRRIYNRYL